MFSITRKSAKAPALAALLVVLALCAATEARVMRTLSQLPYGGNPGDFNRAWAPFAQAGLPVYAPQAPLASTPDGARLESGPVSAPQTLTSYDAYGVGDPRLTATQARNFNYGMQYGLYPLWGRRRS